jgi:hypothetical protein
LSSLEAFARFVENEIRRWAKAVKDNKIVLGETIACEDKLTGSSGTGTLSNLIETLIVGREAGPTALVFTAASA